MQERTGAGASRRLPLSSAYLRPVLRLVLQLVLHGDMAVRPCGRLLGSAAGDAVSVLAGGGAYKQLIHHAHPGGLDAVRIRISTEYCTFIDTGNGPVL